MILTISILLALGLAAAVVVTLPAFGRLPRGERLERVRRSPNYRDGEFRNLEPGRMMTGDKSRIRGIAKFLFRSRKGLRPDTPMPSVKTDLQTLDPSRDLVVWFGHSSYLVQAGGRRMLVDPVFCSAAPLAMFNRPFEGTNIYRPEDMPDVDYLVITHDHWDHLDYRTVRAIKHRVGKVICPLGVGEHFEYWGFDPGRIVELDWDESAPLDEGFGVTCLPARHFSGRGLRPNRTLWASFLFETPTRTIYLGGDGGYGTHFARIGRRFPQIDLAVLENGQYNEAWRYIHTLPEQLALAARDLGARQVLTVHHSKYALAKHRWDEPLENAAALAADPARDVLRPLLGEVVLLDTPPAASGRVSAADSAPAAASSGTLGATAAPIGKSGR